MVILIDRIDDSWDGSDRAVLMLSALMHACVELWSLSSFVRPIIFLRENIFERVRQIDKEFTRLETSVVSLDWTRELLVELVERRLTHHLNTRPPVGQAWGYFFDESSGGSKNLVFDFCQLRPRDILTYCSMCIESAQAQKRQKVTYDDILGVRKQFSQRLFKDLGDEYSENYSQIQVILTKFHGLAREFSMNAITVLTRKILGDADVQKYCSKWIFKYASPYQFVDLLFGIGFWGIRQGGEVLYRGVGVRGTTMPPIEARSHVVIHPSYGDALDLQDKVILDLDESILLQTEGSLLDLPEAITLNDHKARIELLIGRIQNCPKGDADADAYEDIVGDVIKFCLYQYFDNVHDQVTTVDGRARRDWIAANVAGAGFWEFVRARYSAGHVVWECKNYEKLEAKDFHQTAYYMNNASGFCVVLCFRGDDITRQYLQHIKYINDKHPNGAIVILLMDKDLKVFMRQARNQRTKDSHIQAIYSEIIEKIS